MYESFKSLIQAFYLAVHGDILHMVTSSSVDIIVVEIPKPGVFLKYLKRDYLGCGMRPIWGLLSLSLTHTRHLSSLGKNEFLKQIDSNSY